jgi:NADH:ubiquinone oxidoreductase subunit 6 (subunit J)
MMNASPVYIALSLIVLAIIAILVIFTSKKKRQKQPSKLVMFAFLLVVSGIFFGDYRLIGYSLIGAGVLLALIDIITKRKDK